MPKSNPFDNRALIWQDKRSAGYFNPQGALERHGVQPNPRTWSGEKAVWSARVIVGFARRGKKPATMNMLVRIVKRVRTQQTGDPSATFLTQRGLYRHNDTGEIVDEPGAQVVLIDTHDTPPRTFEKHAEEIAETIARELEQAEVIVEIQKNGVSQSVFGVAA